VRTFGRVVAAVTFLGTAAAAFAQPPSSEGFEKVSQLPAVEQLPAAPLLMVAYAFIWVAVLAYVFLLWRRLASVDRELAELRRAVEGRQ
jgi:CcmD family protein